jgi:hypothetical protein
MPAQPQQVEDQNLNPNLPMVENEEGEMEPMSEIQPTVLGPPAYASPDPATSSGALVDLEEHPNAENLSEDFGQTPPEAGAQAAAGGSDYESKTKDELVDMARDAEIEGYSSMNKAELVAALEENDAQQG